MKKFRNILAILVLSITLGISNPAAAQMSSDANGTTATMNTDHDDYGKWGLLGLAGLLGLLGLRKKDTYDTTTNRRTNTNV